MWKTWSNVDPALLFSGVWSEDFEKKRRTEPSPNPVRAEEEEDVLEGYLRPTWSCFKDTLFGLNEVNLNPS